ncbi:hypothetical protein BXU06_14185 [Aquaspirillum sp. LM1]|uniref:phosphorylase family protein n=1 Tax=Aquaspirillum sp. LM1 TaxID=1938604 RepID=UPI000983E225|nr:pentapeptide repeat-containing protein [Aquaspirillum sp. LM1]AQR66071.1 hypothetical protein BXU06_14185 [Aquaspirillum sp. LM1]
MPTLNRYLAEKSLTKLARTLSPAQQTGVKILLAHMEEDGHANYHALREALSPAAGSVNSANTMLKRFLDKLNDAAKAAGIPIQLCTTADKKAGERRQVWCEGEADGPGAPYTGDLNGIPSAQQLTTQRGQPLGQPVLLITFNPHETDAVQKAFPEHSDTDVSGEYPFARLGVLHGHELLHLRSPQGRKAAQHSCQWALNRFQPCAVIAVGIAFGLDKSKQKIGDVLVSSYLFDYENARINADDSLTHRGPRPSASPKLLKRLEALHHDQRESSLWPHVIIGPMACGDKLVDNAAFLRHIRHAEPECIGGEMEGAGLEAACGPDKVDWLVVKGICDWADGHKNTPSKDDDQRTAARNAMTVVKALLSAAPLAPPPDPPRQPVPAQPPSAVCQPPCAGEMGMGDLNGIARQQLSTSATGRATTLDTLLPDNHRTAAAGEEVLPYLRQWLHNPDAPRLFALLGEYGMGKTITCQLLARELDAARRDDPSLPIPLYFDLRHVTGLRERVPSLEDTLRDCMQRGWQDTQGGNDYSLEDIHRWIAQGALLVFDGLDEVLVKLSAHDGQTFTNQLLKLLADAEARAKLAQRPLRLKMLISCRTQYFPTLQAQQSHFTQQERGEQRADRYQAMLLLPWNEQQVRSYLSHALPEMDSDVLLAMLGAVHNLTELSQRPYTLRLLAEHIPDIERLRTSGQPVYGVTLYRHMVEKWLARDSGKHQLSPEHKLRLASQLAAHLWRSGKPALPAGELHDWLHAWLDSEPALRGRYQRLLPEQLEEDLRTATFLARDDDETTQRSAFRFAHTSLLEFFLACHLRDAALDDRADAWALPLPSQETLDFFGQLLAEANTAERSAMLAQLSRWALHATPQRSELLLAYTLRAHRQGWPTPELRNADFSHAKLREWVFVGSAERPLRLEGAHFADADLTQSEWRHVQLAGAHLPRATLTNAVWQYIDASGADFSQAELTATVFRYCTLSHTHWRDASGYRPQWLNCQPAGAPWQADTPLALEWPLLVPQAKAQHTVEWMWLEDNNFFLPQKTLALAPTLDPLGRGWLTMPARHVLQLTDWRSGEIGPRLLGHRANITTCAFADAPDTEGVSWLASGDRDGDLRLWRLPAGEAGPVLTSHQTHIRHCAFSPQLADGTFWLASADAKGEIRLWRMPDATPGPVLRGHTGPVQHCAFAPQPDADGVWWLASAGTDHSLRLWQLPDGQPGPVLHGHTEMVLSCVFMPTPAADGVLRLVSASFDGSVRLWRALDGAVERVLHTGHIPVVHLAASPATGSNGTCHVLASYLSGVTRSWCLPTGLPGPEWRQLILQCTFVPNTDTDGFSVIGLDQSNTLCKWQFPDGTTVRTHHRPHTVPRFGVLAPAPQTDGAALHMVASDASGHCIRQWNLASGEASSPLSNHQAPIFDGVLSPHADRDGEHWLASASADHTVRLWQLADGQAGPVLRGHNSAVLSTAFAPQADGDGVQWLASTGMDGMVSLWQLPEGQPGSALRHQDTGRVLSCSWAPDADQEGRLWLASAGTDGAVRLWRLPNRRASRVLRGHDGAVRCCAFAPAVDTAGVQWLASAGADSTVRLWQTPSGQSGPVLHGHEDAVNHCTFAPGLDTDGLQWLASASDDGTLRLWQMPDGAPGPVLRGHHGPVLHCHFAYTADGALWLASSSDDGTLRVWDIPSGRCLRVLAQCEASPGGEAGYAMWNPETQEVLAVVGDAWRHVYCQQPRPGLLPERLPLEAFGPVPYREKMG